MDLELRHLRCLVAIVDSGSFTDAGIELGVSQAAVSRNLSALEHVLGVRLLHRTSRSITLTTAGVTTLAQARQVLAAAGNLIAEATTGHTRLRIGHAWAVLRPRGRRPVGQQALSQPQRDPAAHPAGRLAHRVHHPGPVASRCAARLPGHPRHRRLARDHRGRRRCRDHTREHDDSVPAGRRRVPAVA
jgi:hypothetical protein